MSSTCCRTCTTQLSESGSKQGLRATSSNLDPETRHGLDTVLECVVPTLQAGAVIAWLEHPCTVHMSHVQRSMTVAHQTCTEMAVAKLALQQWRHSLQLTWQNRNSHFERAKSLSPTCLLVQSGGGSSCSMLTKASPIWAPPPCNMKRHSTDVGGAPPSFTTDTFIYECLKCITTDACIPPNRRTNQQASKPASQQASQTATQADTQTEVLPARSCG